MKEKYLIQLNHTFKIPNFHPFQEKVIEGILSKKDTLIIADTGSGKSLCYQFSALQFEGISIVISPINALILNQIDTLKSLKISCEYLKRADFLFEEKMKKLQNGDCKILYLSPETLVYPKFRNAFRNLNISMIVIDEAHCVSHWGLSFREAYLSIKNFVNSLDKRPVISAFTATAPKFTQADIIELLGLKSPKIYESELNRDHIEIEICKVKSGRGKYAKLYRILEKHRGEFGIVYCNLIDEVNAVFYILNRKKIDCLKFHGEMETSEKEDAYAQFINGEKKLMIATKAFGMGVDKKDIRFVVHFEMPQQIEDYYQETGRAGRDKNKAFSYLIYDENEPHFAYEDENMRFGKAHQNIMSQIRKKKYDAMHKVVFLNSSQEIKEYLKNYFQDENFMADLGEKSLIASKERKKTDTNILYCNGTHLVNLLRNGDYIPGQDSHVRLSRDGTQENIFQCDAMLDYFDLLILDCIYSLSFQGHRKFFIQNIAYYLSGDQNIILKSSNHPSPKNLRYRIQSSLEKLKHTRIRIELDEKNAKRIMKNLNSSHFFKNNLPKNNILEGNLLNYKPYKKSGYELLEMPILFQYANILNSQIYSLPLEMLYVNREKKQSQSVETILLQNFFARRITLSNPKRINQNRRVLSRRIIWNKKNHKDLFQILEIEKSARKIKTIRDKIAVILEYYKSKSLIDDYYIAEDAIEVK